jgi:N-acetylneuraminate synthase
MLERLREIGKPVILSTGASSMNDISIALKVLGDTPVTLLYCVASYPANYVNFAKMVELFNRFGKPIGFSDHTLDVLNVPLAARNLGASVIEKHVNLVGVKDTPDAPHSLSLDHFKHMCKYLRYSDNSVPLEDDSERDMYTTHNRRLIATRDIKAGDKLIENENFGIFRALKPDTSALSPWAIDKVNGRVCKIDIRAGSGITPASIDLN